MQIIPRGQNFFGDLGTGLGELAGLKLGQLVKHHEQKKERSQFAEQFAPILGKDTANFLSNLSPEERKYALQNVSSLIQLNEPPSSREEVSQLGRMHSMQQSGKQGQQQPQQNQLQQSLQQYFNNPGLGQRQEYDYSQGQQQPEQQQLQSQEQSQNQQQLTPEKAKLIEGLLLSPQERLARQKEERENRKLIKSEELANKKINLAETKTYITELKSKEKAAKEANIRLKRMEELIDKGNLPNAALWSSLSKLENAPFISGLTAPIAEILKGGLKWYSGNPADIEEFEKLSNEFIKNAKQYFGSKVTEKEILEFMKTVPTLMQTDPGKKRIISNIRSMNHLVEIEAKAARSIIAENDGVRPIDLDQQVQDKIGNKVDKLANKIFARA